MSDVIDRLRAFHDGDHERGCAGRCYQCSCEYDANALDAAAAIAEITALRADRDRLQKERDSFERAARDTYTINEVLLTQKAALRKEIEKANNEFGSQTADWPDLWRRWLECEALAQSRETGA